MTIRPALMKLLGEGTFGINVGDAIAPTWIDAQVEGDRQYPSRSVELAATGSFTSQSPPGRQDDLHGCRTGRAVYSYGFICPPCRSRADKLKETRCVCNTCGTEFRASDGQGTSGACKGYPKAEMAHTTAGDRLTM